LTPRQSICKVYEILSDEPVEINENDWTLVASVIRDSKDDFEEYTLHFSSRENAEHFMRTMSDLDGYYNGILDEMNEEGARLEAAMDELAEGYARIQFMLEQDTPYIMLAEEPQRTVN
jgi:hypothetical protein